MQLFANNVSVFINQSVSSVATSIILDDASKLPTISDVEQYFTITFFQSNSGIESNWEIVRVTSVTGNAITCSRGFDGTTAREWVAGASGQMRATSGAFLALQASAKAANDGLASKASSAALAAPSGASLVNAIWFGGVIATVSQIASSIGASLIGFIQAGIGALPQSVQAKLRVEVSVLDYGADPTGVADSYPAFQAATNYIQTKLLGGLVFAPDGSYLISGGTVTNDRSANPLLGRVSYAGQSEFGTRITYTGSGSNCFYLANSQELAFEQNASYQRLSDFTLIGPSKRAGSCGIVMNLAAWPCFERLNIQAFDFGVYLQDVDHPYFEKVNLRFNNKGCFAAKSPTPGAASTQPNNFTFLSCSLANNSDYALVINGGASVNMYGGSVENNGTVGAGGFGLQFVDSGYEGGRGANIQGVYFEGNNGIADVILKATTVNATPMLGVVHQINSDFKRISNTVKTTNHILCAFGADATVGKQSLVMNGSSFKTYGSYAPSAGTPVIAYSITPPSITNFFDHGSYYMSSAEKPEFTQNLNKKDLVCSKGANQTFSTGVSAKWMIDSVINASQLWSPTITSGNIIIDDSGTYQISIFAVLSTSGAGAKSFTFSKNGTVIGVGEASSATNVVGSSLTTRFLAGDILTINYLQATGSGQDIVGAESSQSSVTIAKIF